MQIKVKKNAGGIAWNDPGIGIVWPRVRGAYRGLTDAEGYALEDGTELKLSEKDQKWSGIKKPKP